MDKRFSSIRDIARLAGVSIATVSRVLNTPDKVSPQTCERVMRVIEQHRYIPNRSAVNLYSGDSRSIAFFVYDLSNPFYSNLVHCLNEIAVRHGYTLLVADVGGKPEIEAHYLRYFLGIRISSIILTLGSESAALDFGAGRIPVVCIDRAPLASQPCYCVQSDCETGTRLLLDELHAFHHRRIGYVTGTPGFYSTGQRLESFRRNMRRLGLELPEEYVFTGEFSTQCGVRAFDYFQSLPVPPTAVVTADDQIARGFLMRASARGISVPGQVSVCGMDAVEPSAFYPPITSIQQNVRALAQAAFDCICRYDDAPPPGTQSISVSIFHGQTCAAAPE